MANTDLDFSIVIHGGAGVITKGDVVSVQYIAALESVVSRCYAFAKEDNTKTAVDICEYAVNIMEDCPLFNAGLGSVFNANGKHEMEASIMDGKTLKCGATSLVTRIKNPISFARSMLSHPQHIWIAGEVTNQIATDRKLPLVDSNEYFDVKFRRDQLETAKRMNGVFNDHDAAVQSAPTITTESEESVSNITAEGIAPSSLSDCEIHTDTVGCVCMRGGHVCAATSTGGMTNKHAGRIGDTPVIGAGTYANDKTCAVSATGRGT